MADDLVERLRETQEHLRTMKASDGEMDARLSMAMVRTGQAAARIEALEAALAEARRQALEEAAKVAEEYPTLDYQTGIAMKGAAQAIRALASDALLDRQGDGKEDS